MGIIRSFTGPPKSFDFNKDDFDNIHKLYSFLNKMHVKNIKIKIWIETKNIILGFSNN